MNIGAPMEDEASQMSIRQPCELILKAEKDGFGFEHKKTLDFQRLARTNWNLAELRWSKDQGGVENRHRSVLPGTRGTHRSLTQSANSRSDEISGCHATNRDKDSNPNPRGISWPRRRGYFEGNR